LTGERRSRTVAESVAVDAVDEKQADVGTGETDRNPPLNRDPVGAGARKRVAGEDRPGSRKQKAAPDARTTSKRRRRAHGAGFVQRDDVDEASGAATTT
jgi:hypothetical protein